MTNTSRPKLMLGIVSIGLLLSGLTIWPAQLELKTLIHLIWGSSSAQSELHIFLLKTIEGLKNTNENFPFLLYAGDWLAFAHIMLAILFAGAIRDPVRNIWVIECGLIMCFFVPVLAIIFVPLRGIPTWWIIIDSAFAPGAGIPLYIAYRDVKQIESTNES